MGARALVALADWLGTARGIPTFVFAMLHWAKAFAMIAVVASVVALGIYPSPLGVVAVFMTAVFVTLSILSVIKGAFGKRRDGWSYSATQACVCVALMAGAVVMLARFVGGGAEAVFAANF